MITSNIIHSFVVLISKSEQYFNWEIDVRNDLRVNHIEWTINLSIKSTFIVEFLHNRNIDWDLIETEAKVKITDLIVVVEKHERDLNKSLFYLFYWKIYEWLSFIALKSRYSCKIHAVEAQEVCECQGAKLNWSIHTTGLWSQHLRRLYFQHFFTAIACVFCSVY